MQSLWKWLRADFRNRVATGILVIVPVGATFLVLRVIFRIVDNFASPLVRRLFHTDFPGLGLLLTILVVYGAGLFATNIIGKQIIQWVENGVIARVPVVREVYRAIKNFVGTFSLPGVKSFKRVVLIEYPRPGVRTLGFVTGETVEPRTQKRFVNVFIPTTPNPTSGFIQLVPEDEVVITNISVEEGVRIVVSGGFLGGQKISASIPD